LPNGPGYPSKPFVTLPLYCCGTDY